MPSVIGSNAPGRPATPQRRKLWIGMPSISWSSRWNITRAARFALITRPRPRRRTRLRRRRCRTGPGCAPTARAPRVISPLHQALRLPAPPEPRHRSGEQQHAEVERDQRAERGLDAAQELGPIRLHHEPNAELGNVARRRPQRSIRRAVDLDLAVVVVGRAPRRASGGTRGRDALAPGETRAGRRDAQDHDLIALDAREVRAAVHRGRRGPRERREQQGSRSRRASPRPSAPSDAATRPPAPP